MNKIATKIDRVLETVPTSLKLVFPPVYLYDRIKQDKEKNKDNVSLEKTTPSGGKGSTTGTAIAMGVVVIVLLLWVFIIRGKRLTAGGNPRSIWRKVGGILAIVFASPLYLLYALVPPYIVRPIVHSSWQIKDLIGQKAPALEVLP